MIEGTLGVEHRLQPRLAQQRRGLGRELRRTGSGVVQPVEFLRKATEIVQDSWHGRRGKPEGAPGLPVGRADQDGAEGRQPAAESRDGLSPGFAVQGEHGGPMRKEQGGQKVRTAHASMIRRHITCCNSFLGSINWGQLHSSWKRGLSKLWSNSGVAIEPQAW